MGNNATKRFFEIVLVLVITLVLYTNFFISDKSSKKKALDTQIQTEEIKYYSSFLPDDGKQKGSCWTVSTASSLDNAYRCVTDKGIYDPCLKLEDGHILCVEDPELEAVFELILNKPLPDVSEIREQASSEHLVPWMVKLTDGRKCFAETGAASFVAGKYYYLSCGRDDKGLYVVGELDKNSPIWKIHLIHFKHESDEPLVTETIDVIKAFK